MIGDDLTYWRNILEERKEDLALEQYRDEDHDLIRMLKKQLAEAMYKIKELE
tara:strand:- start:1075 stop:1230 length:156 start_codon:yes stop_codon:yes gene_type:complete